MACSKLIFISLSKVITRRLIGLRLCYNNSVLYLRENGCDESSVLPNDLQVSLKVIKSSMSSFNISYTISSCASFVSFSQE